MQLLAGERPRVVAVSWLFTMHMLLSCVHAHPSRAMPTQHGTRHCCDGSHALRGKELVCLRALN
jgi:hypothetical protein